jgi:dihydroorotate dehydrogenase
VLRPIRAALDERLPLIGVGGVANGDGAGKNPRRRDRRYLYSALVYEARSGRAHARSRRMLAPGVNSISEIIGVDAQSS